MSKTERERGAAVVEFTLVSVVLFGLFLAVLQFALVLHVRNTLVACVAEGARHAANADRSLYDGEVRAAELIAQTVSADLADSVRARHVVVDGVPMVEVTVDATLPLVGLLGVERGLTVRGHAVSEAGL